MLRRRGCCVQHVAVACSSGRLHFLRTTDGAAVGTCDAGGAVRAAPVTDPWLGHVWIASHGRQLTVCKAPGQPAYVLNTSIMIAKFFSPAPIVS